MTEEQKNEIRRILDANDSVLRRMAEGNGALLAEYRDCIVEIALRTSQGIEVPEKYAESVDELANEIVRRMNR